MVYILKLASVAVAVASEVMTETLLVGREVTTNNVLNKVEGGYGYIKIASIREKKLEEFRI